MVVVADTSRTEAQMRADLDRAIRQVQAQLPGVQVRVDTSGARRDIDDFTRDAQGRLRDARGRFISEAALLGRGLGDGLRAGADDADSSLARLGGTILRTVVSMARLTATASLAIAPLVGIGTAAASAVAALGGLEGIANQAAGGLAILAAARGVLQVALTGVSEVIGTLTGSTEDFEKALETLSPEAQKVAREFRAIAPELTGFRTELQDALFTQLQGQGIADRFAGALGKIRPQAAGVAGAFGEMFARIAENITTPEVIEDLNTILSKTEDVVRALIPRVENLGAAFIDRAADGVGEFGGTLDLIRSVIAFVQPIMTDFGRIFSAIGQAAEDAGGSLTGPLGGALGIIADLFESAAGQTLLRTLIDLGNTIVEALAPAAFTLVEALAEGLAPVVEALAPAIEIVADTLADVVTELAPLLPLLGQLIASALPVLIPLLQLVATTAMSLLPPFVQFYQAVLPALIPLIDALVLAVGDLIEPISELAIELGPAFADLFTAVTPHIITMTEAIIPLIPVLTKMTVIMVDLAADIVALVVPALKLIAALLRGDFSAAGTQARDLFDRATRAIVGFFTALPRQILSAISSLPESLRTRARDAGERMRVAIRDKVNDAVDLVRDLPGRAGRALSGLGDRLYNAGRSLIGGFINGMRSRLGDIKDAASDLLGAARDFFPFSPAKVGPFSGMGYTDHSGEALVRGFIEGIKRTAPELTRAVNSTLGIRRGPFIPGGLVGVGDTVGLTVPNLAAPGVNVDVFIGNEQLDGFIDTRVQQNERATRRLAAQGVRR